MVPQNIIDEILNKVSIVSIIGKYTELKRSGKNYLALCPFHQEKTPSFSVSEEKGLYYCFGCGASGNTISFLMDHNRMSFMEALGDLAKDAGINLDEYSDKDGTERKKDRDVIYKVNQDARVFYNQNLLSSADADKARQYLKRRKIALQTVKAFCLGYGGKNWSGLTAFLKEKGYSESLIVEAGLASKGNNGPVDRFKDRVIFPILDKEGKTAGFGGRILTEDKNTAKYLNSAENSVFHKGNILYSLNLAKDEIILLNEAILVEGYMDVIGLHQNGILNAVAPLGTALTDNQLNIIKKYAETVYFIFDGDSAGIKAANRALDIAAGSGLNQWVVILPASKDPYDYVMEYGRDKTKDYFLKRRLTPIDFKMKFFSREINLEQDKIKFLLNIFPYIVKIGSPIGRENYLKAVSYFLKEELTVILAEYQNYNKKNPVGNFVRDNLRVKNDIHIVEMNFVCLLILFPGRMDDVRQINITSEVFESAEIKEIFELVSGNPELKTIELISMTNNPEIKKKTAEMAQVENLSPNLLKEVAYKLKLLYIKKRISKNRVLIEQFEKEANFTAVKKILAENPELSKEASAIEQVLENFESDV